MSKVAKRRARAASPAERELLDRLNQETAKVQWSELARFFAAGKTIYVAAGQDLLHVASAAIRDDHRLMQQLLEHGAVQLVSDQQAQQWHDKDASVWALVVAPWVLVQEDPA
ncbi:MAG: DUF2288 family protein [Pseudomonadales bacterium]|nr:DUF2288 domain-containing protein [Gammaproteobacteria bacterium]NNL57336.1 DUF2288 family protein [Pseudomonadales bacterium]